MASVTMGYGHLRAAYPLAERLGVEVLAVDEPPIADPKEARLWGWVRHMHEVLSKPMPFLGPLDRPARGLMDAITMIPPLHETRDHRAPTWSVRVLDRMIKHGLGMGMVEHVRRLGAPLITTFYACAIIAERAGIEDITCVITDADCNRVWAPLDPTRTRIRYAAPTPRVVRRLRSFGVPERNITLTGFPLPPMLTDPSDTTSAELRLAERIARLDPRGVFRDLHGPELARLVQDRGLAGESARQRSSSGPVHLMFAVGGAGAQVELVDEFLPALRPLILEGRLRLQLVAGTRPEVLQVFSDAVARNGLERVLDRDITLIHGRDFKSYYEMFNRALLRTDVLWTKPSELSFYPALGVACMLSRPLGAHERYNRRWLREQGVGLKHRRLDHARGWFEEWLEDGTLAGAAWSGFVRLPKHGTERIAQMVLDRQSGESEPRAADVGASSSQQARAT
ncbi:MAG TPA: hypothetical protein VMG12_36710 [Polyangiaceae bacterium]|nr:hypothetical protein [Polyangiaceae bacterium]